MGVEMPACMLLIYILIYILIMFLPFFFLIRFLIKLMKEKHKKDMELKQAQIEYYNSKKNDTV